MYSVDLQDFHRKEACTPVINLRGIVGGLCIKLTTRRSRSSDEQDELPARPLKYFPALRRPDSKLCTWWQ
jgi:hypothetical protein